MTTRARVFGRTRGRLVSSLMFLVSGLTVACFAGATLGSIGYVLGQSSRNLICLGILIVVAFAAATHIRPPQLERETNRAWLLLKDWRAATYNAATLSLGFTTRIGFWLFFVIPLGAFLTGSAWMGALVYGTYAATRLLGSLGLAALSYRSQLFITIPQRSYTRIRPLSDAAFLMVAGYLVGVISIP